MKISTLTMLKSLRSTRRITDYLERYREEMLQSTVSEYLNELLDARKLALSGVAERSGLGDYVYKVFKGTSNTGRNNLLCIAAAMELSCDETQRLLRIGGCALLDPRRRKDAIVLYGLEKKLSNIELNLLLFELGEAAL